MKFVNVPGITSTMLALAIAGCGGGGGDGGPAPARAIVKVHTAGTLPANTSIGTIQATVTASPASGLSIGTSDVSATGNGAAPDAFLAPNTAAVGAVVLGLISANGIPAGEFATLTYHIAPGNVPAANVFGIAGATASPARKGRRFPA